MKILIRAQAREMALLRRKLARENAKRLAAEEALKLGKKHYGVLLARSELAKEQKRQLARQVILAQEEERRLISRALHDEVSQILTGINVNLMGLSGTSIADARKFKARINATRRMVEKSVKIVHRFARELRPVLLDELGLIPALHSVMKILTRQTGLHIRFTAFAEIEKLGNARRTALFRVVQSALNNVARHAMATNVTVKIVRQNGSIDLQIHDDGKSFQVERVLQSKRFRRLGLIGMRERIEMFGGTLNVSSAPGKGTTVSATLPFGPIKEKQ